MAVILQSVGYGIRDNQIEFYAKKGTSDSNMTDLGSNLDLDLLLLIGFVFINDN